MNIKKTIVALAIAMAVAFVATVGMASAVTLYADNSLINAGTVTVSDDGTNILITYDTTGGWELTAYHIYVSTIGPPIKSAPGQFEFKEDPVVPATTSITIPTISSPTSVEPIYIAAQAELRRDTGFVDPVTLEPIYEYESGWGDGTQIRPGKNWAMYFTYIGILGLENKDPSTWEPITGDEMYGILEYYPSGPTFNFVFDGHGLVPSTDYSLIYYKDPWPGAPATCLASDMSDGSGNINLVNSIDLGMDLVDSGDPNDGTDGAKIWLVLSGDVTCGTGMTLWNPTEYLFENNGIFYDDTDA